MMSLKVASCSKNSILTLLWTFLFILTYVHFKSVDTFDLRNLKNNKRMHGIGNFNKPKIGKVMEHKRGLSEKDCPPNTYFNGYNCIFRININKSCSKSIECGDLKNLVCVDDICACKKGMNWNFDLQKCQKSVKIKKDPELNVQKNSVMNVSIPVLSSFLSVCQVTSDCKTGLMCANKKCDCPLETPNWNGSLCVPSTSQALQLNIKLSTYQGNCSATGCMESLTCLNNTCLCTTNNLTWNGTSCVDVAFVSKINYSSHQDSCNVTSDCADELVCVNSKCDCNSNSQVWNSDLLKCVECGTQYNTPNSDSTSSWPWICLIYVKKKDGISYYCDGTLISNKHVITTAHCVENYDTIQIWPGLHNASDKDSVKSYGVSRIYAEDSYNSTAFQNGFDYVIVELNMTVIMSNKVSIICLPTNTDKDYANGKSLTVAGWGVNYLDTVHKSLSTLQEMNLTVSNNASFPNKCSNNTNLLDYTKLYCMTGDDVNTSSNKCSDGSGSPGMLEINLKWYLYGIRSFGYVHDFNSCLNQEPSFFVPVCLYREKIIQFIANGNNQ